MLKWILLVGSSLSMLYFIGIALFAGFGNKFIFFWMMLSLFLFGLFIRIHKGGAIWMSGIIGKICGVIVLIGVLIFIIVEICIISNSFRTCDAEVDYVIVLGAQMKASGPSRTLKYRLDAAYEYLIEHDQVRVIVSGGQGADEPVSEAQGMFDYLVEKGISKERILMESHSINTNQNIAFSGQLVDIKKDKIVIVTNNFHLFRAMKIAKKAGYENLYGIAAKSELFLQLHYTVREFFGVVKDYMVGNM